MRKVLRTLLCVLPLALFLGIGLAQAAPLTEVTDSTFEQEVINHDGVVVVEAYATWCPACRAYGPEFKAFAEAHTGEVKFVRFDVDANPTISTKLGIRSLPTTVCFAKNQAGEVIAGGAVGAISKEQLGELVTLCSGPDAESQLKRFDY